MERSVIVIVGPTCSGKSHLALMLAKEIKSEIVSADSRQFYKYLNIGTAKPSSKDLKEVKHHLIDFLYPDDEYNVSRFEIDSEKILAKLLKDHKQPIVVGGSGLYIKAIIQGIFTTSDKDEDYRNELNEKRKKLGNEFLYQELKKVDPQSARKMLPQNWKRVMRALEVFHLTGKPLWEHHLKQGKKSKFLFHQFGLMWNRETLYDNINKRVDKMIEGGLVEEVEKILSLGYSRNLNALNTVGYREVIQFLDGNMSLESAADLIKRNTRHYAKRQITWFKQDKKILWFKVQSFDDFKVIESDIIRKFN